MCLLILVLQRNKKIRRKMKKYKVNFKGHRTYFARNYLEARKAADRDLTIFPAQVRMAVQSITEEE